ncbi:MBL fold metallo-hydrolase [Myroides sp. DW712]|uniref:MBL fold metallo-hydrolase n=1 Tax=Myroides sp. DW712 TaxID=3389800 RepID=UPI00397A43C6
MNIQTFNIEKDIEGQSIVLSPTVIQQDNFTLLVDCGYEETFDEFKTALAELGMPIQSLDAIFISHDDIDHLGALSLFLAENPNLQIYASAVEKDAIEGTIPSERLVQAETSLPFMPDEYRPWAEHFITRLKKIKRAKVHHTFQSGDFVLKNLQVIATPGHTKGHISLFDPQTKTLIANDALVIEEGKLNIANPQFTLDMQQAILSVKKIQALQPHVIICYHGGILKEEIERQLEMLLNQYE